MERASSLINGKEIAIFNKVRMHLKVATLSDILTADGMRVDASKLKGEYASTGPNPSRDAYEWPIVPPPTATEKRIWTETICTMCGITQNNRQISGTITRHWGKESSKFIQWSYDETSNEILEVKENCGASGNARAEKDELKEPHDSTEPRNKQEERQQQPSQSQ